MSFWNGNKWVAHAPPPDAAPAAKPENRAKRLAAAALEASLITALTFGLIAGSAFAARGGPGGGGGGGKHGGGGTTGGSGTISLASPLVMDKNGNGTPNWGDFVRFNVSTTSTTQPYVNLYCYQNGVQVAGGSEGYFAGALDDGNFGLYAPSWMSGAADCTAKLVNPSGSVLGSTSFHVDA
jgi:hypothetical protein